MSIAHFLPLFAVITCLELAVIFFLLSRYVDAEKSNAIFSLLCLCFACMIWSTYELVHPYSATFALLMYRIQLASGMFASAAAIHFARFITQSAPAPPAPSALPLPQRFAARWYALTAVLALCPWHPLVLHRLYKYAPVDDYDSAMAGLWFRQYILLIFSGSLYACGLFIVAWKQNRKNKRTTVAVVEEGYRVFASQTLWFVFSFGLILLASVIEFIQAMEGPDNTWNFPVFPRAWAILVFCFTTAYSLAKQIVVNERRKAQIKAVAQTRLEATRHIQHQVRNALAQIQRPLHTVLEQPPLEPSEATQAANRQRVARASAAIEELQHTLDVALNLARVEVGEPVKLGAKASVPIANWTETLCRNRLGLEEAGSTSSASPAGILQLKFHADLSVTDVYVYADALREVFAVLLDNACKYAPKGSLLTVQVWNTPDRLCFCVADQGCGVRLEDKKRIFELYRGRQPSVEHIAGTGIGLTLAKRYIEARGGSIRVESDGDGQGSAFYFHIPLEKDEG